MENGEQLLVELVHLLVVMSDLYGLSRITGKHDSPCAVAQIHCESAHLGELIADRLGYSVLGVAPSGDGGDVDGQGTHPFGVGDILHGRHDSAQVTGHRCLQRQQRDHGVLGFALLPDNLLVLGNTQAEVSDRPAGPTIHPASLTALVDTDTDAAIKGRTACPECHTYHAGECA